MKQTNNPDRQTLASHRQRAHRDFLMGWPVDCRVEFITLGPDADDNVEDLDETGLPWPELPSRRVLDVGVRDGEAVWRKGTEVVCRVGELNRQTQIR